MLKKWALVFFVFLSKVCLKLRYRIRVQGLESIKKLKEGILFLPSHPAEIDPVILMSLLWPNFKPRTLVVEHFYYLPGIKHLMRLIGAFPIPDMMDRVSNKWKQKKIEQVFTDIRERLQDGENFLIYPSGKLRTSLGETIGGASFVHSLVDVCPQATIVLIRTTGLWGSKFSKAFSLARPDFGKILWEGFKIILKNGIFFAPKRDVLVEIELAPADFPFKATRLELNKYLEGWYNKPGLEPISFVPDLFWKKNKPSVASQEGEKVKAEEIFISPAIEKEVIGKIGEMSHQNASSLTRKTHLSRDLGFDSLDIADLYIFLENKYDLENLTSHSIETVGDLLIAVSCKEKETTASTEEAAKGKWKKDDRRPPAQAPVGQTIQEAFLRSCDRMHASDACADNLNGVMSYRRFKLGALILAKKIKALPGDYIGILLPSSSSTYLVIMATLLAKKIPVMLNWTVGIKSLEHCVKSCNLSSVLTSRRFLNNLHSADITPIENLLVLLEEIKEEISFKNKLSGFYNLLKDADSLLKDLDLGDIHDTDPAVILFTSGTETLPKGVPLSHYNILSNQKSAFSCVDFKGSDIFYGVLPPFHSFGFSVTGLFPLLTGVRVFYSPDPTEYKQIAREIKQWESTVFCCAPTFIKGVFQVASKEQLSSLRYIVSGAEKTPQALFDYVKDLGDDKELIEGYGITECAPIVTITRPGSPKKGVGKPIPDVKIIILDIEKESPLPIGQEGEICIRGPNVFYGYLGSQKAPFITLQGKRWYRSGDRGFLDKEGNLILSGRLKRFAKIGGEMVSLGGLEEELLRLALDKKWPIPLKSEGPLLAVSVLEKEIHKPVIVLFATFDISREEVNMALREIGHGGVTKIGEVRRIEQIPLTGTGKIHYRALDEII